MRRKITYDPAQDYYTVLGIPANATPDDIRQAYRRCVREIHPDLNPHRTDWATDQLQRINEAYDVLREPVLRREYDQLRWPHLPSPLSQDRGSQAATRGPFSRPYYDPNLPWWEQATTQPASGRRAPGASRRTAARPPQPVWINVAGWLKRHHLAAFEPSWMTLVGLWRSPYAGLLTMLTLVLAFNVALIVYLFIAPEQNASLPDLFDNHIPPLPTSPPTALSGTPDHLNADCTDPAVQITAPASGELVGDSFSVRGTVDHPAMWAYHVQVGYLGRTVSLNSVPSAWIEVRSPPEPQSIAEPAIVDDLLTDTPVVLDGQPDGYYAIRLRIELGYGETLQPCDVIVRR